MKRYYAFIGFWLGSAAGVCIFALVILEAKEQNKDTIPFCTPSEEHQQVMERLESVERACSQN